MCAVNLFKPTICHRPSQSTKTEGCGDPRHWRHRAMLGSVHDGVPGRPMTSVHDLNDRLYPCTHVEYLTPTVMEMCFTLSDASRI